MYEIAILGAGASGLMVASLLPNLKKIIIEGNDKAGLKIKMSGGGNCNFTNKFASPNRYNSLNPHFTKSAISKYSYEDFINIMNENNLPFQERENGKFFGFSGAKIANMLTDRASKNTEFLYSTKIINVKKENEVFIIETSKGSILAKKVIVATGGLSIPKAGATDIAYKIAKSFGIKITPLTPALVGLPINDNILSKFKDIRGVSCFVRITYKKHTVDDSFIFTHSGISGLAVLRISLFWEPNNPIFINFLPNITLEELILEAKNSKKSFNNHLKTLLPSSVVDALMHDFNINPHEITKEQMIKLNNILYNFELNPKNYGSYNTAEVTKGGIDTDFISSKTMEAKTVKNLYFCGECLDVTGELGGYNLHWAWSSAYACAEAINSE